MMQLFETFKELIECKNRENSKEIERLFQECGVNNKIEEIFVRMEGIFIRACVPSKWTKDVASCYIQLALKLHQFVLSQIIIQEESNCLNNEQLGVLLCVDTLHISLLAVSLQLIIYANTQECNVLYMWIYQIFNIESFDILKVLDQFQNVIYDFPTPILQRITAIEKEIVEYSIWKSGSPIYSLFASSSSDYPNHQSPNNEKRFLSPLKVVQAFNSSIPTNNVNPSRPKIVCVLLRKIYEIVYAKVKKFAQYINLSTPIEIDVRRCFEFCINFKTELFVNRHLDQILMCCIYGVCKVHSTCDEVSFQSIISAYRKIKPHNSPIMWKKVWMGEMNCFKVKQSAGDEVSCKKKPNEDDIIESPKNENEQKKPDGGKEECGINGETEEEELMMEGKCDSIIKFYNVIFINHAKQHLLATYPIMSPKRKVDEIHLSMHTSPNTRMFGDGLRVIKMDKMSPNFLQQHTPRTIKLFSFGNSPISSLKSLSPPSVVEPTSHASKKLKFDSVN